MLANNFDCMKLGGDVSIHGLGILQSRNLRDLEWIGKNMSVTKKISPQDFWAPPPLKI